VQCLVNQSTPNTTDTGTSTTNRIYTSSGNSPSRDIRNMLRSYPFSKTHMTLSTCRFLRLCVVTMKTYLRGRHYQ
jgi:hypothetical protein